MSSVAVGDFFGGEREVVEASLGSNFHTLSAGAAEEGNRFDGGEVHDVQVERGREVCEGNHFFDGVGFECRRTRG